MKKNVGHDLELIFADNVNKGNKKDVGTFPLNPTGNTEDRMMELITIFFTCSCSIISKSKCK